MTGGLTKREMHKEKVNWFYFLLIEVAILSILYSNHLGFLGGIFGDLFITGMNPSLVFIFQGLILLAVCIALKLTYKISTHRKFAYFIIVVVSLLILYFPFHYFQSMPVMDEHTRRYIGTTEYFKEHSHSPIPLYLLSVLVFIAFMILNIPKRKTALQ